MLVYLPIMCYYLIKRFHMSVIFKIFDYRTVSVVLRCTLLALRCTPLFKGFHSLAQTIKIIIGIPLKIEKYFTYILYYLYGLPVFVIYVIAIISDALELHRGAIWCQFVWGHLC